MSRAASEQIVLRCARTVGGVRMRRRGRRKQVMPDVCKAVADAAAAAAAVAAAACNADGNADGNADEGADGKSGGGAHGASADGGVDGNSDGGADGKSAASADKVSDAGSDHSSGAGSDDGAEDAGRSRLGGFFAKAPKGVAAKRRAREAVAAAAVADGSADGNADGSADGSAEASAVNSLGAFFKAGPKGAAAKRRVREASEKVEAAGPMTCVGSFGGRVGRDDGNEATATSHAARSAWKQRGEEGGSGDGVDGEEEETTAMRREVGHRGPEYLEHSSGFGGKGRVGHRTARGWYRQAAGQDGPRTASDATRCHWLIAPDSLLIRLDPQTSMFLQRQWLAAVTLGRGGAEPPAKALAKDSRGRSRGSSFLARLNAGWLAQTLRPRGWFTTIPEDEECHLPMPVDCTRLGEPDRVPMKPSEPKLSKVMLRIMEDDD